MTDEMNNNSDAAASPRMAGQTLDPATRTFTTDRFTLTADRRQTAFVMLRSGLSHDSGHIQYLLSVAEARELANELLAAAAFAAIPTLADKIRASQQAKGPAPAAEPKSSEHP